MAKQRTTPPRDVVAWKQAIAERSAVEVSTVDEVLSRYSIQPQSVLARARTLLIQSIEFSGSKDGTDGDGAFSFLWKDLGPGLFAALSDDNLRGKSSVLKIILSALRGDFPGGIKPDVWRWIETLSVCFAIDSTLYRVNVEKPHASDSATASVGRKQGDAWVTLHEGPIGEPLETYMDLLFMEELSFPAIRAFNRISSSGHSHGWQSIASALMISGSSSAIFGTLTVDGMPLRLLQLFMGLPWIGTYTAAVTAQKQNEAATSRRIVTDDGTRGVTQARLSELESQLELLRTKRPDTDRLSIRAQVVRKDTELSEVQSAASANRSQLAAQEYALRDAQESVVALRSNIQQLADEAASGVVFRSLRPVCCPACEAELAKERYAAVTGTCALCGEDEDRDVEAENDRLLILQGDLADAMAYVSKLTKDVERNRANVSGLETRIQSLARDADSLGSDLSRDSTTEYDRQLSNLEGRVDALREVLDAYKEGAAPVGADAKILEATVAVTKSMYEEPQADVLSDLSAAITDLSKQLGVKNIASMEFNGAGALQVSQGGAVTHFSKLTAGERLRVRIAAAIAVVEVARVRGYGRHPGLLILDSPRSEEMADGDFAQLLSSVESVVSSSGNMQVIIGAIATPELVRVVPKKHTKYATGKAALF